MIDEVCRKIDNCNYYMSHYILFHYYVIPKQTRLTYSKSFNIIIKNQNGGKSSGMYNLPSIFP